LYDEAVAENYDTFYVVVNVLVVREGMLLLGKRKNVIGAGKWGLPGGHLENGERIIDAGRRELAEETGLTAAALTFASVVNMPHVEGRGHYLQIGLLAEEVGGEPQVREPRQCSEWRWFALERLPDNLFAGHGALIAAWQEATHFGEVEHLSL
jgi:8-oxo-dGTP diphosphatase